MLNNGWIILKSFIRTSLDNYVLPGTATGTDILLLYMMQWTRHFALLSFATYYLICSQLSSIPDSRTLADRQEMGNTDITC